MEMVEILKMTLEDYEQIKENLTSDFDDFWNASVLKSELLGEQKEYLVAKKNGEIVGFAGILRNPPEMEIMNIVTKKQERKKGIGAFLLNKMLEIAENNQVETIFLEVNEKNVVAKKLYENAGFCQIGRRKNYYGVGENAILMSKKGNNLQK